MEHLKKWMPSLTVALLCFGLFYMRMQFNLMREQIELHRIDIQTLQAKASNCEFNDKERRADIDEVSKHLERLDRMLNRKAGP